MEVGLEYLTLDRQSRTLSGGEVQRVNLTSALGSNLVNTLYVLDEPSIGLHPRDNRRLIKILSGLRTLGNTVVVVEHEPEVMREADRIIDMGPGAGAAGGRIVFNGTYREILKSRASLTGKYLLRKLAEKELPKDTSQRKKMPFYVPIEKYFEQPAFVEMMDDLLSEESVKRRGIFRPDAEVSKR